MIVKRGFPCTTRYIRISGFSFCFFLLQSLATGHPRAKPAELVAGIMSFCCVKIIILPIFAPVWEGTWTQEMWMKKYFVTQSSELYNRRRRCDLIKGLTTSLLFITSMEFKPLNPTHPLHSRSVPGLYGAADQIYPRTAMVKVRRSSSDSTSDFNSGTWPLSRKTDAAGRG